ncbi:MAG: hypothetical protein Q4G65_18095 [bacterium]|nr:hypothetical protein [bacterium]
MEFSVETEYEANLIAQKTNLAFLAVLALLLLVNTAGYFGLPRLRVLLAFVATVGFTFPALLYGYLKRGRGMAIRYLEVAVCLFLATTLVTFAGFTCSLVFLTPLVLASVYLDRRFLLGTYSLVLFAMLIAALGNSFLGVPDVNLVSFPESQILAWRSDIQNVCLEVGFNRWRYFRDLMWYSVVPNAILSGIVLVLVASCIRVGRRRAEAAEAYSQGLLDTMGASPRPSRESTI